MVEGVGSGNNDGKPNGKDSIPSLDDAREKKEAAGATSQQTSGTSQTPGGRTLGIHTTGASKSKPMFRSDGVGCSIEEFYESIKDDLSADAQAVMDGVKIGKKYCHMLGKEIDFYLIPLRLDKTTNNMGEEIEYYKPNFNNSELNKKYQEITDLIPVLCELRDNSFVNINFDSKDVDIRIHDDDVIRIVLGESILRISKKNKRVSGQLETAAFLLNLLDLHLRINSPKDVALVIHDFFRSVDKLSESYGFNLMNIIKKVASRLGLKLDIAEGTSYRKNTDSYAKKLNRFVTISPQLLTMLKSLVKYEGLFLDEDDGSRETELHSVDFDIANSKFGKKDAMTIAHNLSQRFGRDVAIIDSGSVSDYNVY